jgi:hypothetical protein
VEFAGLSHLSDRSKYTIVDYRRNPSFWLGSTSTRGDFLAYTTKKDNMGTYIILNHPGWFITQFPMNIPID